MKAAKFTRSDDISAAVPVVLPFDLGGVFRGSVEHAACGGSALIAERLIRDALLNVIGFTREDHQ